MRGIWTTSQSDKVKDCDWGKRVDTDKRSGSGGSGRALGQRRQDRRSESAEKTRQTARLPDGREQNLSLARTQGQVEFEQGRGDWSTTEHRQPWPEASLGSFGAKKLGGGRGEGLKHLAGQAASEAGGRGG